LVDIRISSDIGYIRIGEGFHYLCQVRDVMTNIVLEECQAETMKADLVSLFLQPPEGTETIGVSYPAAAGSVTNSR